MLSKELLAASAAAALILTPVTRANADTHGLIGAIIGGAIVGSAINNSNKRTTTKRVVTSSSNTATRNRNRETQTALNYFGFNAGTPDGVLGRNSRAAISGMQAYLAFPVTGKLTQFERDILIGAYQRGISGSPEAAKLLASAEGSKALLADQKALMTGAPARRTTGYAGLPIEVSDAVDEIADSSDPSAEQLLQRSGFIQLADLNKDGKTDYIMDTSFSGSSFWCSSVQCKAIVFASTADGYQRNDLLAFNPTPATFQCIGGGCVVNEQPATVMASTEAPVTPAPETGGTVLAGASGGGALPVFGAPAAVETLSSLCNKVSVVVNAGGVTTVSNMTDPNQVLREQFCAARAVSIAMGDQLVASLPGVTLQQVDAQCGAYGEALQGQVAGLSLKPRAEVVREMGSFVLNAGMDPAQLANTAKICLSSGYRTDNMGVAIGSGLLLVALGEGPYGELMGHHLTQGFGASKRTDLAMPWYEEALAAVNGGAIPVLGPNQPERPALLQAAVTGLSGGGAAGLAPISASGAKPKLPTFGSASQ
jgi:hypothetical protein